MKRYILALTEAEIGALRSALSTALDGDYPGPDAAARRAIAKIDAARNAGPVRVDIGALLRNLATRLAESTCSCDQRPRHRSDCWVSLQADILDSAHSLADRLSPTR